jgi:hypothetical protein
VPVAIHTAWDLKVPRRLAGQAFRFGLREFAFDFGNQPIILRQSEQKVHPVCLAPSHSIVPRETAVGAHQDAHMRPPAADVSDDARHFREAVVTTYVGRCALPGLPRTAVA